jgi:hypothetical protein
VLIAQRDGMTVAVTGMGDNPDETQIQMDVTAPQVVQVVIRRDGKVVWINVNGQCLFRACQVGRLDVDDQWRRDESFTDRRVRRQIRRRG